jgi:tissue inhibitor of metalloproteinase
VRRGRVAFAVVLIMLLGLLGAGEAFACSCAPTPPRQALARADAAIVGRLLKVEARGPARAAYRYRVIRVYRGGEAIRSGNVMTVLSSRSSAACALPTRMGRNYGLFLLGEGDRWASGLCGVISPRRLWVAAQGSQSSARPGTEGSPLGASCAS